MADLERQLRRRSARGQLDPAALLVDVNAAIDSRPQPIRRSRLAPAGALLGVLALLLLVIFGPRLLPTLQVGRSPTPPPAGALSVLSADVFGRLLAEGRLSGRTVLVEGRIGDSGYRGLAAECFPASPCVIGELEGTGALVYSHGHAAPGPLTVLTPAEPFVIVDWQWPQPPIEGTLVFYVDVRNAEYVGHVRAAADGLTWSASEAADVDRAGLAPDEVLLVDGWLTGASIPCAPENELTARDMDHPSVVIELPSRRGCMGSWLTDAPVSLIPDQFERPAGGLQVQDGAWWEFAPEPPVDSNDVGPRRAVYMVGERVFGAGCPEQSSPCRDWVVAARLGGPPPPLEPTAPDPLVVLTPVQFAAQLAAGELDGRTIRVDGRIVEPADGVSCVPFTTCSLGLLEDTSVEVFVEPLPTTEERASIALPNRGRQDTWRWWMQPTEADLRGRLVLHVEKLTRRVDYLGVTRATDESEIWQPSAMRPLDVEAVDQAHVVLVDGWLWAPRRDEPVVCTLVGFPEGLPDGQCPHPVWLTDSRPSDEELAGPWQAHLDPRPDGITLAGDPLYLVGGEQRAQPVHGRFAVAPRLWGCLGDSGLCWSGRSWTASTPMTCQRQHKPESPRQPHRRGATANRPWTGWARCSPPTR
ncbi:MAG TPA: hypothetical protein VNW68_00710 [Candidatus Limnocylindria bacterium]|nr:hypothetical protein [Candidatus Limnocylindria bacterium]